MIGAYRVSLSRSLLDPYWQSLVRSDPEAWSIVVHEAAELEALRELGMGFFDARATENSLFEEARVRAVILELRFLQIWAAQSGVPTNELALERALPYSDLEAVTAADVRTALRGRLEDSSELFLTAARELPADGLMSPAYFKWVRQWWEETVDSLRADRVVKAS